MKNKYSSRNTNQVLLFKSENKLADKTSLTLLENIFTSKPVGVTANYSIDGIKQKLRKRITNNLRFKETMSNKENQSPNQKIPSGNMEAPIYRKDIPPAYQADFDVLGRVASKTNPTVSNEQGYNAIYPDHKSWYDEKKYKVIDTNFSRQEDGLLTEFQETLDKGFDKKANKNLKHAEDFDKSQFDVKNMGFTRVPRVIPHLVKGGNYNHQTTKVTKSDPYKQIFGDKLH